MRHTDRMWVTVENDKTPRLDRSYMTSSYIIVLTFVRDCDIFVAESLRQFWLDASQEAFNQNRLRYSEANASEFYDK